MKKAIIYIHGKGGNAAESEHYKSLFTNYEVLGFDYESQTPWEALAEFSRYFDALKEAYDSIEIIANSIGAYFALTALNCTQIEKAYFISPVVDMEKLITDMMKWAGINEDELEKKRTIETSFGETLSYEYLNWVRQHPVLWEVPTSILYGNNDNLQSIDTIRNFAKKTNAELTIMESGEHWFHTKEQMEFLDQWIINA